MGLLTDIEAAEVGNAEIGARALEALTKELHRIRRGLIICITVGPSNEHTHVTAPDISTDLGALWDECERRGYRIELHTTPLQRHAYPRLNEARLSRGDGHKAVFAFHASIRLALLLALLRAEGVT